MKIFFFLAVAFLCSVTSGQEDTSFNTSFEPNQNPDVSLLSQIDLLAVNFKVDSIITNGIKNEAFPGAQVLVAHKGKVVFHNAYGFHTYDSLQPVGLDDLYDLASVTKILAPLPALMKLVDEGKLDLDIPFSTYWKPWRKRKDKKDLNLREILAHQAGLKSYTIFLNTVLDTKKGLKRKFIRETKSKRFPKEAYKGLYVKTNFNRKMYRIINRSKVSNKKNTCTPASPFSFFQSSLNS